MVPYAAEHSTSPKTVVPPSSHRPALMMRGPDACRQAAASRASWRGWLPASPSCRAARTASRRVGSRDAAPSHGRLSLDVRRRPPHQLGFSFLSSPLCRGLPVFDIILGSYFSLFFLSSLLWFYFLSLESLLLLEHSWLLLNADRHGRDSSSAQSIPHCLASQCKSDGPLLLFLRANSVQAVGAQR